MNKRKLFGTIIGIVFWSICVVFFTYAYYEWKSEETSVVIGIQDLSKKCIPGTDVNATNIGPVLDYKDGVKAEFSIENGTNEVMAIDLRLDITSISDNLLTESFKYAVVTDITGETNYDYDNPVIKGSFTNFNVGSNLIMTDLAVSPLITQSFLFIIYIDGNMYNSPNMQENSLVANLMIGNCEENSISMDEFQYQAIYSETDNSLTFVHTTPLTVGDTYNEKSVSAVYTGFETKTYNVNNVPWYADGNYLNITSVDFEAVVSPVSTAYWFKEFGNLTSINLERLNTSNVTNMVNMFYNCSNLTSLDLSNFDTSNVTSMSQMFYNCSSLVSLDFSDFDTSNVETIQRMFMKCSSLTTLDLSSFDTSNVTSMEAVFSGCRGLTSLDLSSFNTSNVISMGSSTHGYGMFQFCNNLIELDVSSFDTSNVTNMGYMFEGCNNLIELDLSNFDTSKVTNMFAMFQNCSSLTSLDLSGFDTSNVTNIGNMFYKCSSLTSLDLSGWGNSNITSMSRMFFGCSSLTTLDLSSFDTSNVTDMHQMFSECGNLTNLDLSGFNTSNVTNMGSMFYDCNNLTTEITIMNTGTTSYGSMFYRAATSKDSDDNYIGKITINYIPDDSTTDINESTENIVDAMIATGTGNIEKVCYGTNCPIVDATT